MNGSKTSSTFPELQKYARRRRLFGRNGFYLEIHSSGGVSSTKNKLSPHARLQFLSVGPNLVAIWGSEAKKYLAIDDSGHVFTTESEKKECVLREYFGKNFYSLFRTCHSDQGGRGWYLSIDECGRVASAQVNYSDEPRLHFIVQVVPENPDRKKNNTEMKELDQSAQASPIMRTLPRPYVRSPWCRNVFHGDEGNLEFDSFNPSPQSSSVVSRSSDSYSWSGSIEFSLSSDTV